MKKLFLFVMTGVVLWGGGILAAPNLTTVHIESDNATPTLAKVGDTITLDFSADAAIQDISVTILGRAADAILPQGGNDYRATLLTNGTDAEGNVSFQVDYATFGAPLDTASVSATTDASAVIFDRTVPTLAEVTAVATPTNDTTPDYTFSSDEAGAITYGGGCNSATVNAVSGNNTITLDALADGTYGACTITVTDSAGNASAPLAMSSFTIDTVAPTLGEVTAIATPTTDTTPDYTFSSDEAGAITYGGGCSSATVNAVFGNNTITLDALADGTYGACTITVTDSAGNASAPLAMSSFTVDSSAPLLSEVTAVATPTNDTTPDYTFSSDEAGSITYGGGCSSATVNAVSGNNTITLDALADGTYGACTITVTDSLGNASAPLTLSSFTIDTIAPTLGTVAAIADPTADNTPDYTFSSDEAGSITYGGGCSSTTVNAILGDTTITLNTLADGTYNTCTVTVTDSAGNGSFPLLIPSFRVDTAAPVATITAPIPTHTNNTTPSLTFTVDEDATLVYSGGCNSITANALAGINTITLDALAEGTYTTCAITLTDSVGNFGALAIPQFSIDTTPADLGAPTVIATTGNPGYAKAGDQVTYSITYSEPVTVGVLTATTANNASVLTQDVSASVQTNDTVIFTVQNGDNGIVTPLNIDFNITDRAGNITHITSFGTINGGPIEADTTAPTLSPVSIASNNANPAYAKTNDTLTVSFTALETITNISGTLFGENATVTNTAGDDWTLALMTDGNEAEGTVGFAIDFEDLAGNAGTQVSATTDASAVTFDKTAPTVLSAVMTTDNPYSADAPRYYARTGNIARLTFQTNETVQTPAGTILGRAATITDMGGNIWQAEITLLDTDAEGTIPFNISVYDMAGNGDGISLPTVSIIATTDGSSILFDRTAPQLPTLVQDGLGAETANFKHRNNASFTWSGQNDLDANATVPGSGIYQYEMRLDNAGNAVNHTATLNHPASSYTPPLLPPADPVYTLRMNLIDKAGNESGETIIYSQKYTIGLSGTITDADGAPIKNALVYVVARYGETCDTGLEVCNAVSDANGNYSLILQKDRNYNVTYFGDVYHAMQKQEIRINQDDINFNANLTVITNRKLTQTRDQSIVIVSQNFIPDTNPKERIQITVESLSGEITASNDPNNNDLLITSLSRITSVTSNHPTLVITDNGDNTFTIPGGGTILAILSAAQTEEIYITEQDVSSSGTNQTFTSGSSRLGVKTVVGNGKYIGRMPGQKRGDRVESGQFWTEEESKADVERANKGIPAQVNSYINRNGYAVFAGYQPGRLPLDRLQRAQNQVSYRGGRELRHQPFGSAKDGDPSDSQKLEEKMREMKDKYQDNATPKHNEKTLGPRAMRADNAIDSVLTARTYREAYVNKFAVTNPPAEIAESRMEPKDMTIIRMQGDENKTLRMSSYLSAEREDSTNTSRNIATETNQTASAYYAELSVYDGQGGFNPMRAP